MKQRFELNQRVGTELGDGASGRITEVHTDGSRYPYNEVHYTVRYDNGSAQDSVGQTGVIADRDLFPLR